MIKKYHQKNDNIKKKKTNLYHINHIKYLKVFIKY